MECSLGYLHNKEGNGLFNDTLNTFYLRLYGVVHMVKVYTTTHDCQFTNDKQAHNPNIHVIFFV